VARQHKVLLDYVPQEMYALDFNAIAAAQQATIRMDAEE